MVYNSVGGLVWVMILEYTGWYTLGITSWSCYWELSCILSFGDELMYVGDMIMGRTRDAVLDEESYQ